MKKATLVRIKHIAKDLGYVADPMLSALNAYRHAKRPLNDQGVVAWITSDPGRDDWRYESFRLYREGAAAALARHGYQVEDFWLREPGMTSKRASQILFNRGIRGILICPLPTSYGHLSLQWERFSAVTFGYTLHHPTLHLFTASHFHSLQTCLRQLHLHGYRRIGMVISDKMVHRMNQIWLAAYFLGPTLHHLGKMIPPHQSLHRKTSLPGKVERNKFLTWFRTYRPDAIVSFHYPAAELLREEDLSVPADVGIANPILQESMKDQSGVIEASREIGRAAGDFLVGMIHRGESGPPPTPQRILLDGHWNQGTTVRGTVTSGFFQGHRQN
ncbi:MAG TPA: hypothetical protein VGC39_04805 [Candidatus Methylacidiphilales bacterium]